MKKILIAFDGKHFSEGAMQMAAWINEQEPALVTGVFLSPIDYREVIGYTGMGMGTPVVMPPFQEDDVMVNANIAKFEERCRKEGFEYRVHKDTELFALQELMDETRFADLLIVSSELFYDNIDQHQPNDYLKKTLQSSECPVMLVPEQFIKPFSLIFSYDGKASSVFAIRQFTYLFPACSRLDAILVYASEESDAEIPQLPLIEELMARHYESVSIEHLAGENREGLTKWVGERRGSLLVTGAYGRGELSSMFKKSFVTDLVRQHRIPIFIAHR
jgi:nucleotide-binding universal stress UspA family protein